ncbi:MAG: zinc ribbon-containing protein [Gammaproteobacteria bacterium]|nr:zinc ribbon-containing protein [Gammaproteobacteria bacterium]
MSQLPPPRDPIEVLGTAYELLLEKALDEAHRLKDKTGPVLHKIIDASSERLSELGELTEIEAEKISRYLKRDLIEAASYISETGDDLKKWLAIDTDIIEDYLLEQLQKAADQTTVQLNQLKTSAENAEYHTGEICGPGVLICDQCGKQLHFHRAGHIPPCPKCKNSIFHRLHCH